MPDQVEAQVAEATVIVSKMNEVFEGHMGGAISLALAAFIGRQAALAPVPDLPLFLTFIGLGAQDEFDLMMRRREAGEVGHNPRLICPVCSGTQSHTPGRGHDNDKDTCTRCASTGMIDANPGTSPETSYNPQTGGVGVPT